VVLLFGAGAVALRLGRSLRPLIHARLWLVLGLLFVIAALDDMFKLHEKLDFMIVGALGLDPDGPADVLDDIIVALYAVPSVAVVATIGRSYFLRLRWTALLFGLAAVAFTVMVLLDFLSSHDAAEESMKLVAGGLIFGAVAAAEHSPLTERLVQRACSVRNGTNPLVCESASLSD
jgi:hypothetical protein